MTHESIRKIKMADKDNNKKRNSSFRKLFPNLFFSYKSKEGKSKRNNKDVQSKLKSDDSSSKPNHYQDPRSVIIGLGRYSQEAEQSNDRIYENLTVVHQSPNIEDSNPETMSYHSSSSTLVSASVTNNYPHTVSKTNTNKDYTNYAARPQVPPKPYNELAYSSPKTKKVFHKTQYPDVYYHSLEKLSEKKSPLDDIEIYNASQTQINPASVGAEIKKVSTKFIISPKKEAEVRTLQPARARSLSFNKDKEHPEETNVHNESYARKPYIYSAPTSPIPLNHKVPHMPKTVSPYEQVRKTMIAAEEKRNSLRRSTYNNSSPSPSLENKSVPTNAGIKVQPNYQKDNYNIEPLEKEKTRQRVEAFYWQKLKELKEKEDAHLLGQAINSPVKNNPHTSYSNSNCSTPNSLIIEPRSYSLPCGQNLNAHHYKQSAYSNSPFARGAPERRTDTFIAYRSAPGDTDIVYRHQESHDLLRNLSPGSISPYDIRQMVSGYISPDFRNINTQPKRVKSFEERYNSREYNNEMIVTNNINQGSSIGSTTLSDISRGSIRAPPHPPVRTTSTISPVNSNQIPNSKRNERVCRGNLYSESESGSEAGEIRHFLQSNALKEEDWHGDNNRIDGGFSDGETSRGPTRSRSSRRDDPRRHTLSGNGNHNNMYIHSHHPGQINVFNNMESLSRGYPSNNAMLFDDDPGIMSEVETSSTGFRRGGKQRSSLPVVRTPSKTLERPLGLVFLQYRNETKRALLPNEITSIDTVKALFVRSFSKQLTMQYLDSPDVKIYIHDSSKDMFYELEDVRAHLRDIRDRSVLRLFESSDINGGVFPGAVGVGSVVMPPGANCSGPSSCDFDQSYFSEPEIDSEYHHQHVHKTKVKAPAYYMGSQAPSTLPRGGSVLRPYTPSAASLPVAADRVKNMPGTGSAPAKPLRSYIPGSGSERCFPFVAADCTRGPDQPYNIPGHPGEKYMSSPERGAARTPYEDPYYTQFLGPSANRPPITPIIDEEAGENVIIDDAYQAYGINPITTAPRPMPRPPYDARPKVEEMQRLRVEKMERQLANLTGLVQKALQAPGGSAPPAPAPRQDFQTFTVRTGGSQDAVWFGSTERPPKLGRDKFQKSVSFEKSVSFSDDPPDLNSPVQHSPQHTADTKPTKPAIKSSTLPRTSSQERDRLKPAPPPKPAGLIGQQMTLAAPRTYTITVTPEFITQLRLLLKQSRDLRIETRNLRRSTLSHAIQMRQMMADTVVKIGTLAANFCEEDPDSQLTREEEIYRQDLLLLENDLYELEATVERLRGQAANRETRVNMADIERIAMVLSKSSKTVADWKLKFPILQETMKVKLSSEMEKVVRKEKMLEEEPERLELALRRCKKLTGTLVTLKRLACVQEQRLPITDGRISPGSSQGSTATAGPSSEEFASDNTNCPVAPNHKGTEGACARRGAAGRGAVDVRPENALDALLDELQTFAKPAERGAGAGVGAGAGAASSSGRGEGSLRRLHSYPSGSDTDASPPVRARGQHPPKPPVPERHPELLAMAARRAPPPPPPRTTSRSPLASPTSPRSPPSPTSPPSPPDALADDKSAARQAQLERRHQELLKKQKALQEQYARLQMIQRNGPTLPSNAQLDLKKTGSESNLLSKLRLNLTPAVITGSMTHLAGDGGRNSNPENTMASDMPDLQGAPKSGEAVATTNKVYETDIL